MNKFGAQGPAEIVVGTVVAIGGKAMEVQEWIGIGMFLIGCASVVVGALNLILRYIEWRRKCARAGRRTSD